PASADVTHDHVRVGAALHLWERHRPHLLLVHLVDYDTAAHESGPMSPQALAALEQSDAEIARIRACVFGDRETCLVVFSDHVLGHTDLWRLGADPDAALILDAAPGFLFSDRSEGQVVRPTPRPQGTHGHLPSRAGLEASFIAVGPGIKAGKNLGRFPITRVG